MGKADDLDRIDKAIKDAELRQKSIETNIENIDKEIAILAPRKTELEQSIEFHKRSNIIPLAHEYKKNKTELAKIKARLSAITSDRNKTVGASHQVQEVIDKLKRDHQNLSKASDNNVLRVLFGRKNGQK